MAYLRVRPLGFENHLLLLFISKVWFLQFLLPLLLLFLPTILEVLEILLLLLLLFLLFFLLASWGFPDLS